jgi:hypothetical protein
VKHSAHALITAAKRDTPRASLEGEILGALGAGATLALAPSLASKLWLALKHAAMSKAGVATIAFTAATGGYAAGRLQTIHEQTIAIAPAPTPTHTPTPARMLTPTPVLTQTEIKPAATPRITTAVTSPKSIAVTITVPKPNSTSLADEVIVIKRARAALLAKNAEGAIDALDDYDRGHPSGAMAEESLALRVRADRLAGDELGATEALTKLEQRFPTSVQLAALRAAR